MRTQKQQRTTKQRRAQQAVPNLEGRMIGVRTAVFSRFCSRFVTPALTGRFFVLLRAKTPGADANTGGRRILSPAADTKGVYREESDGAECTCGKFFSGMLATFRGSDPWRLYLAKARRRSAGVKCAGGAYALNPGPTHILSASTSSPDDFMGGNAGKIPVFLTWRS